MKKLKIIFLLIYLIESNSCNDKITNPKEPQIGRRDYLWKTYSLGKNNIREMWGYSFDDIWAVNPNPDDKDKKLWHFDGNDWISQKLISPISPYSIFGTSPTNIWISSIWEQKIWLFNSSQSQMHTDIKLDNYIDLSIAAFDATAPYNVYGVGIAFSKVPQ